MCILVIYQPLHWRQGPGVSVGIVRRLRRLTRRATITLFQCIDVPCHTRTMIKKTHQERLHHGQTGVARLHHRLTKAEIELTRSTPQVYEKSCTVAFINASLFTGPFMLSDTTTTSYTSYDASVLPSTRASRKPTRLTLLWPCPLTTIF
jgi:hypothetical protein